MITDAILNVLFGLVEFIVNLLPALPAMPASVTDTLDIFLDMMFQGVGLVSLVIDFTVFKTILTIVLSVSIFEYTYRIVMWVARKLPIGVE